MVAAAENGRLAVVDFCLEVGVNVDVVSGSYGNTPLANAALGGHLEVVKALLLARADPMGHGSLALKMAALEGHQDVVGMLLDAGADMHANPTYPPSMDVPPTLLCPISKGHLKVAKLLLNAGAYADENGGDALLCAVRMGRPDMVSLLVSWGADVGGAGSEVPVVTAAEYGRLEVMRLLIDMGADIQTYCDRAVFGAARQSHESVMKYLVLLAPTVIVRMLSS
ncbi:hypothetical protein HDV00_006675 [Rhizophlyctis rosea]|nr:hypothetical protein HDV00_006675 [Rhizophlyctis rosea]